MAFHCLENCRCKVEETHYGLVVHSNGSVDMQKRKYLVERINIKRLVPCKQPVSALPVLFSVKCISRVSST